MTQPPARLDVTFQLLASTENEAAVSLLLAGLDVQDAEARRRSLETLLRRRSPSGHREVVRRWHTMSPQWREVVSRHPTALSQSLRDALLGSDEQQRQNACDLIATLRVHELLPTVVAVIEDPRFAGSTAPVETLLALLDALGEDAARREGGRKLDPFRVKHLALSTLERSVRRFSHHRRAELIEAFLVVASRENTTLGTILRNPRHEAYLPLVELLSLSSRSALMRLLLSYLEEPQAPSGAIALLVRRADPTFVGHLLRRIGNAVSNIARQNLRHVDFIPWLTHYDTLIAQLDDGQQHSLVQFACATAIRRNLLFDLLAYLAIHGKPGGRRAAVDALASFEGHEANELILRAVRDSDPRVEAAALAQIRRRRIPGSLHLLIERVDSPRSLVRRAACESLVEFSFPRYLAAFDLLDEEVRQSTGVLVRKVDATSTARLRAELESPSRKRRMRGLEMAVSMGLLPALQVAALALLDDSDHLVRLEAVRALGTHLTADVREALEQVRHGDRSVIVREAAQGVLETAEHGEPAAEQTAPPLAAPTSPQSPQDRSLSSRAPAAAANAPAPPAQAGEAAGPTRPPTEPAIPLTAPTTLAPAVAPWDTSPEFPHAGP